MDKIFAQNIELCVQAARTVRRYPDCDLGALKDMYPDVDMKRLLRWKEIQGQEITNRDV